MNMVFVVCCAALIFALSTPGESFIIPDARSLTRNASLSAVDVCTTPKCIEIAKFLRLAINTEADPCDDFYEYACGTWHKLNPIPQDKGKITVFKLLADKHKTDLEHMMNTLDLSMYKEKSIRLVADVYKKCMDEEAMERVGAEPLRKDIDALFGTVSNETGHTFKSRASSSSSSLEDLVADLWFKYGVDVLIASGTGVDRKDTHFYHFYLDQAPLALGLSSEDYYLKQGEPYRTIRSAYLDLMSNVSMLLWSTNHSSEPTEQQIKDAQDILDFEIELAKLNTPSGMRRNLTRTYNKMKPSQLKSFGQSFNLTRYIHRFGPMKELNVVEPAYLFKLNSLLAKSDTNLVKGYFLWMLILKRLAYISKEFSDNLYAFFNAYTGQSRDHKRAHYCINYLTGSLGEDREKLGKYFLYSHVLKKVTQVAKALGYAMGRLFVDLKKFNNHNRQQVHNLIHGLITSFRMMLKKNNWMDEETKSNAYKKVNNMISKIGYPDVIMIHLDSLYEPLLKETANFTGTQIAPSDGFYEINTKLNVWMRRKNNLRIGLLHDRHSFVASPAYLNAWFSPTKNSITLPVSILQSPCYNPGFPMAINFGCIGSVIGHEIIHGFDDKGSQFDDNGNLVNWWTRNSKQNFNKKAKCMIDQYSKFCYPELGKDICVKGIETQGENIADNAGVLLAFHAYKNYMMDQPDLILPTFENFTQEQMFFLSHAYFYCSNYRNGALTNQISTDTHAPGKERVNGPYQNLKEFSNAFNCPVNSKMNPEKKCAVW